MSSNLNDLRNQQSMASSSQTRQTRRIIIIGSPPISLSSNDASKGDLDIPLITVNPSPPMGPGYVPQPMVWPPSFSQQREEYRETNGNPKYIYQKYSMSDVARGTKISLSMISRIFNGERGLSMNAAKRISNYLKISVDEVIRLVENWDGHS